MNDVLVNKIQSIQRCVARARSEYNKNPTGFDADFTAQDAAVLNILRACEQVIDLANHIIKMDKLGVPNSSADSFDLLYHRKVLSAILVEKLKKMVRFRNMIIHQYEKMDIEIVKNIIQNDLNDLVEFTDSILAYRYENPG